MACEHGAQQFACPLASGGSSNCHKTILSTHVFDELGMQHLQLPTRMKMLVSVRTHHRRSGQKEQLTIAGLKDFIPSRRQEVQGLAQEHMESAC